MGLTFFGFSIWHFYRVDFGSSLCGWTKHNILARKQGLEKNDRQHYKHNQHHFAECLNFLFNPHVKKLDFTQNLFKLILTVEKKSFYKENRLFVPGGSPYFSIVYRL